MEYSSDEWGWIEAEWAFCCHGRAAFISPGDFRQAKAWAEAGIPAEVLVAAMGVFFERRARRPRPRAFVALSHLGKDVAKEMSFRKTLSRAGEALKVDFPAWDSVKEPLQSDFKAKAAFEAWMRLKCDAVLPESSGYLEHLDSEHEAYRTFIEIAAESLGPDRAVLEAGLTEKLRAVDISEGSVVWKRAWDHHFAKDICAAWGLKPL
ncbi:MAG: hypothetical protein LBH03_03975 [Holophagales bacterium]|jgi:hypothetical protein|nr:hypothetical protein [Holophagales bacterium]